MCHYFDDIIEVMDRDSDFDFNDTLLDKKLQKEKYGNILIYNISQETSMHAKPLCVRFDKIDVFIKGCVCYIFASLFLGLNESTCQIKKNVFYFTLKPLFVFEKIEF